MLARAQPKNYLAEKKSAFGHLRPKGIVFYTAYSTVMWGERSLNCYVAMLKAEDALHAEQDLLDERRTNHVIANAVPGAAVAADPAQDWGALIAESQDAIASQEKLRKAAEAKYDTAYAALTLDAFAILFCKAVSCTSCRRALEDSVLRLGYSDRALSKLVKDVPKSAVRKLARTGSRLQTSAAIFRTALRGEALGCISVAIVEQLHFSIVFARKKGASAEVEKQGGAVAAYAKFTLRNTLRAAIAVAMSAVGASAGSAALPGYGTSGGQLALRFVVDAVLNTMCKQIGL